jgi:hypothetical protein
VLPLLFLACVSRRQGGLFGFPPLQLADNRIERLEVVGRGDLAQPPVEFLT